MRSAPLALLAAFAVLLCAAPAALAQTRAEVPEKRVLIEDGPSGRYLMGGNWLFRKDEEDEGEIRRFFNQTSAKGWTGVTVPNAWNATDESNGSMEGNIVWYRKDFRLPDNARGLAWLVRFQNVRYHAQVWLNGRRIGEHHGAYQPWEVRLSNLKRGTNRLVLRVDNRRFEDDLPPAQFTQEQEAAGGWWNYGGILGEVYLRRVNRIDMEEVEVRPLLPSRRSAATIAYRVRARNYSGRAQRVRLTGRYGSQRVNLGLKQIGAGRTAEFRARLRVRKPRLWSPPDPQLYRATLEASAGEGGGMRRVASYSLHSGIRKISVVNGELRLNDEPVHMRGVFLHEDDIAKGAALDNADREKIVNQARELGATLLRTHYPMHPRVFELADRLGLFIWAEIPVFQVPADLLRRGGTRRNAEDMLRTNILTNQNHPSTLTWSVSNELRASPGSTEVDYYRDSARLAKRMDPTRPVSTVYAGYPNVDCQAAYRPFDLLGVNSYFGWYPGSQASIADRDNLSPFLDQVRACYPQQALAVTEHGAEANREGPEEERGTYGFQREFYNFHNEVYATKPWLSGVIGTLRSFRVRPGWAGGNPRPTNPWHEKGVIDFFDKPKPAYSDLQRWFRGTTQYGSGAPPQ